MACQPASLQAASIFYHLLCSHAIIRIARSSKVNKNAYVINQPLPT